VGRLTERLDEHRQTFQPGLWSRLLVLGVIGVYLVLFVVFNSRSVKVRFVFATTKVSLIWVILLSLLIGIAGGLILSQLYRYRQRRR
jgi:uncharacterized integral membrane protein